MARRSGSANAARVRSARGGEEGEYSRDRMWGVFDKTRWRFSKTKSELGLRASNVGQAYFVDMK
jgi:hypothetical protein